MTDTKVYFIYKESFDREAKNDIVNEIYEIQGIEPAEDWSTISDRIADSSDVFFSFSFESIVARLDVTYDEYVDEPGLPSMRLSLSDSYFLYPFENEPDEMANEHIADFIELILEIYDASLQAGHEPLYVFGAAPSQVNALRGGDRPIATTADGIREGTVEQLYWLQILPSEMVADLGHERILSAPASIVEELKDGAILLVAIDLPETPTQEFMDLERYFSFEPDW